MPREESTGGFYGVIDWLCVLYHEGVRVLIFAAIEFNYTGHLADKG